MLVVVALNRIPDPTLSTSSQKYKATQMSIYIHIIIIWLSIQQLGQGSLMSLELVRYHQKVTLRKDIQQYVLVYTVYLCSGMW
jgi:hypothetical protein